MDPDNASEKPNEAPYLKLSARDAMRDGSKATSSWTVLKDLHMSIVDGGVSILKKITGTIRGFDASAHQHSSVAGQDSLEQPVSPPGVADAVAAAPINAEPTVAVPDSNTAGEPEDFGGDWIDDLLEELDAEDLSGPAPAPVNNKEATAQASTDDDAPSAVNSPSTQGAPYLPGI